MSSTGRNNACPCNSGKKYKKCCLPKTDTVRLIPATDITPEEKCRLQDLHDDTGKIVHGSPVKPIECSHLIPEDGEAAYAEWEQEYVTSVTGPCRLLSKQLLKAGNAAVDRILVLAKDGIGHVFYFDMSRHLADTGQLVHKLDEY